MTNSKGKKRQVSGKELSAALKTNDALFVDFLNRCLEWVLYRRFFSFPTNCNQNKTETWRLHAFCENRTWHRLHVSISTISRSVGRSVGRSVCLSVCLSPRLVSQFVCLSVWLSVCLSVCLSDHSNYSYWAELPRDAVRFFFSFFG